MIESSFHKQPCERKFSAVTAILWSAVIVTDTLPAVPVAVTFYFTMILLVIRLINLIKFNSLSTLLALPVATAVPLLAKHTRPRGLKWVLISATRSHPFNTEKDTPYPSCRTLVELHCRSEWVRRVSPLPGPTRTLAIPIHHMSSALPTASGASLGARR